MRLAPKALNNFHRTITALWRRGERKIGLAISGGVDSMALAHLVASYNKGSVGFEPDLTPEERLKAQKPSFVAFIVDHKLREGSRDEAFAVAKELSSVGIESQICTLDWTTDTPSATNLESAARKLRYRALGAACRDQGITALLVAHHADDQAETVLTRICSNYLGTGLTGIRDEVAIPECHGMYGIHESGRPLPTKPIAIEAGGVRIFRPLHHFRKTDLVSICKKAGVKWFEDPTNTDAKFTIRNTIRSLLTAKDLPAALTTDRLIQLADRVYDRQKVVELRAEHIFAESLACFDPTIGTARFEHRVQRSDSSVKAPISVAVNEAAGSNPIARSIDYGTRAVTVRKMLEPVSPKGSISLQDLDQAVSFIYPFAATFENSTTRNLQVAGVNISRLANPWCVTVSRSIPTNRELTKQQVRLQFTPMTSESEIAPSWTGWHLWDSRYWIRLLPPSHGIQTEIQVVVRFFQPRDLATLRQMLSRAQTDDLNRHLDRATGSLRYTIPAIAVVQSNNVGSDTPIDGTGEVVALPALGWSASKIWQPFSPNYDDKTTWRWEIAYKNVKISRSR